MGHKTNQENEESNPTCQSLFPPPRKLFSQLKNEKILLQSSRGSKVFCPLSLSAPLKSIFFLSFEDKTCKEKKVPRGEKHEIEKALRLHLR
jgi:hypothetical protein